MEEMEVKVIEIDKQVMVKKLLALGAKKIFQGKIKATSYDFEDDFLTKDKSFLRLRKKGDKSYLTFKKKITQDHAKVMKEYETEVDDFDATEKILMALRLKPARDYVKNRTTYNLGEVLFEFDEYEMIPAYMEIEAPTIELINKYIEKLEIDRKKVKTWTGGDLFHHYGIDIEFMRI